MTDAQLALATPTPSAAAGTVRASGEPPKMAARKLDFFYNGFHALKNVSLDIAEKRVTALIGPSGCGKSTLLRIFNRIYSIYPKLEAKGEVMLDGENILDAKYPLNRLRSKVGMVFQKPVPFPMTIFENVAYGIRHHEKLSRADMNDRVEQALRQGALFWQLRTATSLARLWLDHQDRAAEARALLGQVYDRFSEEFETADLKSARVLLDVIR